MARKGLSLATKLIVAVVVLLALAVGAGALSSQRALDHQAQQTLKERRKEGERAMDRQATLTLRNLVTSAALPLAETNLTYLEELVGAAIKEDPHITWLAIRDAQSGKDVAVGGVAPAAGATRYDAPIKVGDKVVGAMSLAYSTAELEQALDQALAAAKTRSQAAAEQQLVIAALILLVGILFGAIQSIRMTRQLQVLNHQAGQIAAGHLDQRVKVTSKDEIGQLAESFNVMAESLGALIGATADKASLERELELARNVQDLMSPPGQLHRAGMFSLSGRCDMATQAGGDWWSFRELSNGKLLIVVGDVTGHGMPAAMVAASARGALEAMRGLDDSLITPTRVLEAMDHALRTLGHGDLLMTCFSVLIDPAHAIIEYANAGHVFPYTTTRHTDGSLRELTVLAVRGNPLGTPTRSFNTWRRPFKVGDVLFLATDGLIDRINPNGDRFGERRYRALLTGGKLSTDPTGAEELRDHVIGAVDAFGAGCAADDDVTIVVVHFHGQLAEVPGLARVA